MRRFRFRTCSLPFAIMTVTLAVSLTAMAQAGGDLQAKLAAIKQSAAENQTRLHQY